MLKMHWQERRLYYRMVLIGALVICLFFSNLTVFGQIVRNDTTSAYKTLRFKSASLIIPTALIGYGVIGLENDAIIHWNSEIRHEVLENVDKKVHIDDYSRFVPILSVYGLNAVGIKGKSNFKNRTVILATSCLIMGSATVGLKSLTRIERPDGSARNSFPSGHTAIAFMGAEFLWQEYKDVSIWYGVTGYVIATGTGFLRIYNNRHWLTDVAAGAGIGILSTKIAYWMNPLISNKLFKAKKDEQVKATFYPYYNGEQVGLGVYFVLK